MLLMVLDKTIKPILNTQEKLLLKFHQIKVYLRHNLITIGII